MSYVRDSSPPWAYVVIFDGLTTQALTRIIDQYDTAILNWMTVLPQTVFVVSDMTAAQLATFLREHVRGIKRLLILDAETDRNGFLPPKAWAFLRDRKALTE